MELQRRSSGVAKGGLATGIIGTALGGLNSLTLLGAGAGMLGGLGRNNQPVVVMDGGRGYYGGGCCGGDFRDGCACSEDRHVNRYELELQQKIAEKDSQIALRDANTFTDQKNLEMYRYVDGRLREVEAALAAQAVVNQKTNDDVLRVQANLDCCCKELRDKICDERRERRCADNTIVTYANSTFYAKLVAGITPTTTTTPQQVYNPLPQSNECCCG